MKEQLKPINDKLVKDEGIYAEMQNQKKWVGLDGKPTTDDMKTHWDENGFLDIRETEEEAESGQETSGVETDTDVLRSD